MREERKKSEQQSLECCVTRAWLEAGKEDDLRSPMWSQHSASSQIYSTGTHIECTQVNVKVSCLFVLDFAYGRCEVGVGKREKC